MSKPSSPAAALAFAARLRDAASLIELIAAADAKAAPAASPEQPPPAGPSNHFATVAPPTESKSGPAGGRKTKAAKSSTPAAGPAAHSPGRRLSHLDRERIKAAILANPNAPLDDLARQCGCSRSTVAVIKKELRDAAGGDHSGDPLPDEDARPPPIDSRDPAAPFGYTRDGKPRKRLPRPLAYEFLEQEAGLIDEQIKTDPAVRKVIEQATAEYVARATEVRAGWTTHEEVKRRTGVPGYEQSEVIDGETGHVRWSPAVIRAADHELYFRDRYE
ncbi:MAG: helix-turn-helix domain-containing protein [Pirellulaceae bacterium]|nr:helix-turn-helix domain-containing protein [Pirellulaceae bacterium]